MVDWDEVFSYKTYKVVNIHDKRLGIIHYAALLLILLYIALYVFWWERAYYDSEVSQGEVALKILGKTFALDSAGNPQVFTAEDLIQPPIEKGAAFIATSILVTNNQSRGICVDVNVNCSSNTDCPNNPPVQLPQCLGGYCLGMGWCPAENVTTNVSTLYQMVNSSALTIWMKSTVSFPSLDPNRRYTTVSQDTPVTTGPGRNLFSVADLLAQANTSYERVRDRGGIFLVQLQWTCYLDSAAPCYPQVATRRLDSASLRSGFNFRYASMPQPDASGVDRRSLRKMLGLRFFFLSVAVGYQVSLRVIVLQLSSALALTTIATVITDFVLQYAMPQRNVYRKLKIKETADMTEPPPPLSINHVTDGSEPRAVSVATERDPLVPRV